MTNKVKAVLISDVHFNLKNLELAKSALSSALAEAEERNVPLIIAGDLNDTKAIMRAECVNAIINVLATAQVRVIVLVGNHDLINEKSHEHSLNFLRLYVDVIQTPVFDKALGLWLIPYMHDTDALRVVLKDYVQKQGSGTLIMHQGVQSAFMGEYVVDKTSIEPEAFDGLRVISGHYHRAQVILCGDRGTFEYIGTPYSVTFAEAFDGPKGIRLLYEDSTTELIPLGLRKHVIRECSYQEVMEPIAGLNPGDLLWLKVSGPASELDKLKKKEIGEKLIGHQNFKLDKVYDQAAKAEIDVMKLTKDELLDRLIDSSEETEVQRKYLKKLWREIL
jgi:DNA repair exonuclease SbcCD nuclease subunit